MIEMKHIINRQKKGISVVITTLIIVVASVVLGTAVTLFATGLFSTGSQQTSITTPQVSVWYNGTGSTDTAVGAAVVRNTGDKIAAVSSITVSGTNIPFSLWYYNTTAATSANTQKALAYGNVDPTGCTNCNSNIGKPAAMAPPASWDIDRNGVLDFSGGRALLQATGPISLNPGTAAIIYFGMPVNTLRSLDVGTTATVTISAGAVSSVQSVSVGKAAS